MLLCVCVRVFIAKVVRMSCISRRRLFAAAWVARYLVDHSSHMNNISECVCECARENVYVCVESVCVHVCV